MTVSGCRVSGPVGPLSGCQATVGLTVSGCQAQGSTSRALVVSLFNVINFPTLLAAIVRERLSWAPADETGPSACSLVRGFSLYKGGV